MPDTPSGACQSSATLEAALWASWCRMVCATGRLGHPLPEQGRLFQEIRA